jgi:hypothetical protein
MTDQSATDQTTDVLSMTPQQAGAALAAMKASYAPAPDPNSPAGARAALQTKFNDPEWYTRFAGGSSEARVEFNQLLERGKADRTDTIIAGTAEVRPGETVTGGQLSTNDAMQASAALLGAGVTPAQIKSLLNNEPLSRADYETVMQVKRTKLGDPNFVKAYLAGGAEEQRVMNLIGIYTVRGFKDAAA